MASHLAPRARRFGPPETVSEPIEGGVISAGALDRRDGSAVVTWVDQGNALGERDKIRFSTRPGR